MSAQQNNDTNIWLSLILQALQTGGTGSGSTTFVQNGLNTYTGGTPYRPTINVSGITAYSSLWQTGQTATSLQPNRTDGSYNSGLYTTIAGGKGNSAQTNYSFIGGGLNNVSAGNYSFIGGGKFNYSSYGSVVAGGIYNIANNLSSIAGGTSNVANANSFIGGGALNSAVTTNGSYISICGGIRNFANTTNTLIGNGSNNSAMTMAYSTVVNGNKNLSTGMFSVIGNGQYHSATTNYSTILNGFGNSANGNRAFIGSGNGNVINGDYSTILNGTSNIISSNATGSTITGGFNYTLTQSNTTLVPKLQIGNLPTAGIGTYYSIVADANGNIFKQSI